MNVDKKYSIEEAIWLVETVQAQKGWTQKELAEHLGVSDRFIRYFKTGERISSRIYSELLNLIEEEEIPPPPPWKVEIHPYVAEDDTPKFFNNIIRKHTSVTKGTVGRKDLQGEPIQLTLKQFMELDKEKIKENFAQWLVNRVEEILQSHYRSYNPLRGREKVMRTINSIVEIENEGDIDRSLEILESVDKKYRPIVFHSATRKVRDVSELDEAIEEVADFFKERERLLKEYVGQPERKTTYTRAYLRDLGLTPEEIEKFRVVQWEGE